MKSLEPEDRMMTYDEAQGLRAELIDLVGRLEDKLSMSQYPDVRRAMQAELRHAQARLRKVKDWLRKNDAVKQSEWKLLARAYQELQALLPVAPGRAEGIEQILDAIELVVPGQYLKKEGTES